MKAMPINMNTYSLGFSLTLNPGIATRIFILLSVFASSLTFAAGGKILATPGVSQVEGAAGGGLVPWAQLAGYASDNEISASGFCSRASVSDYDLDVCGVQANLFDRVELSYAKQTFDVPALNTELEQSIVSAKVRLYGDVVYSRWPQLSFGVQSKELSDASVANLLGAKDDSGVDYYLAASKLHLGAAAGYNLFWNFVLRSTSANEMGLLGFGSTSKGRSLQAEFSSALFLNPNIAFGIEYRQKPDNLNLGETDWRDVFIAWFPNKHVNLTLAYIDLGTIAGAPDQTGWYLSLTGNL